jgi:hypothetical protein
VTAHLREISDWCGVAIVPSSCAFAWAAAVSGELHTGAIVGGVVWLAVLALFACETEEATP